MTWHGISFCFKCFNIFYFQTHIVLMEQNAIWFNILYTSTSWSCLGGGGVLLSLIIRMVRKPVTDPVETHRQQEGPSNFLVVVVSRKM